MPETFRVSWQNKILDTWCILLVIYTKIITMHGHLNIKYLCEMLTWYSPLTSTAFSLFLRWNLSASDLCVSRLFTDSLSFSKHISCYFSEITDELFAHHVRCFVHVWRSQNLSICAATSYKSWPYFCDNFWRRAFDGWWRRWGYLPPNKIAIERQIRNSCFWYWNPSIQDHLITVSLLVRVTCW